MKFRLLGPVELYDDTRGQRVELKGPKQRALLATLLVRSGAVVPVDQLIEELWGSGPPAKAVNALQAHVTRLRRLLQQLEPEREGPERLVTRTHGYSLLVDPSEVDVVRFKEMVARAKDLSPEDPATAADLLRSALALWRGEALEGEIGGSICATEANLLDEEQVNALEALYDACLRAGQHFEAVGELQDLSTAYPLRERFYDQLMVALYRCGRQTEALGAYETARRRLAAELGLGPTPALEQRMQEILRHSVPTGGAADAGEAAGPRGDQRVAGAGDTVVHIPEARRPQETTRVNREIDHLRGVVDQLTREQEVLARAVDRLAAALLPDDRLREGQFPELVAARGALRRRADAG